MTLEASCERPDACPNERHPTQGDNDYDEQGQPELAPRGSIQLIHIDLEDRHESEAR